MPWEGGGAHHFLPQKEGAVRQRAAASSPSRFLIPLPSFTQHTQLQVSNRGSWNIFPREKRGQLYLVCEVITGKTIWRLEKRLREGKAVDGASIFKHVMTMGS